MPDDEHDDMNHRHDDIARALRALPLESPQPGGFARIEAALAARRRRALLVRGFALAASLAAIAIVPLVLLSRGGTPPAETPALAVADEPAPETAEVATRRALIAQNQELEAWVRAQDEPFDGASAYASAGLEDLIGVLDAELARTQDHAREDTLWRQRLGLLEELASVRSGGVARYATNDDAGLVPASYRLD